MRFYPFSSTYELPQICHTYRGSFFSTTSNRQILQLLCFDNHTNCRGVHPLPKETQVPAKQSTHPRESPAGPSEACYNARNRLPHFNFIGGTVCIVAP